MPEVPGEETVTRGTEAHVVKSGGIRFPGFKGQPSEDLFGRTAKTGGIREVVGKMFTAKLQEAFRDDCLPLSLRRFLTRSRQGQYLSLAFLPTPLEYSSRLLDCSAEAEFGGNRGHPVLFANLFPRKPFQAAKCNSLRHSTTAGHEFIPQEASFELLTVVGRRQKVESFLRGVVYD